MAMLHASRIFSMQNCFDVEICGTKSLVISYPGTKFLGVPNHRDSGHYNIQGLAAGGEGGDYSRAASDPGNTVIGGHQ